MGLILFKTAKARRFNHVPIYYDEAKEELDAIKRNAEIEKNGKSDANYQPNVKGQFSKKRLSTVNEFGQEKRKQSNIRLLIIIGILLFIAYLLLSSGNGFVRIFMPE